MNWCRRRYIAFNCLCWSLRCRSICFARSLPHNAVSCERCHSAPNKFGSSAMTMKRTGTLLGGRFIPASEGGIHHRNGESAQSSPSAKPIAGERVSLNPLGDAYIEAIGSRDIGQNAQKQRN